MANTNSWVSLQKLALLCFKLPSPIYQVQHLCSIERGPHSPDLDLAHEVAADNVPLGDVKGRNGAPLAVFQDLKTENFFASLPDN